MCALGSCLGLSLPNGLLQIQVLVSILCRIEDRFTDHDMAYVEFPLEVDRKDPKVVFPSLGLYQHISRLAKMVSLFGLPVSWQNSLSEKSIAG